MAMCLSSHSQYLIGKSSSELIEKGFLKFDDSTYVSVDNIVNINTWVKNDEVILEQYIVYDQKELEDLYIMLEENFIMTEVQGKDLFFESTVTGVTCIVTNNVFTLYYRQ